MYYIFQADTIINKGYDNFLLLFCLLIYSYNLDEQCSNSIPALWDARGSDILPCVNNKILRALLFIQEILYISMKVGDYSNSWVYIFN